MLVKLETPEAIRLEIAKIDDRKEYSLLYDHRQDVFYLMDNDAGMIRNFETLIAQGTGEMVKRFHAKHEEYVNGWFRKKVS